MTPVQFASALAACLAALLTPAHAADNPQWTNISSIIAAKAGPTKGAGSTGLAVDPATGDLYVGYGQAGIWKSTDHGQTFALCDGGQFTAMGCSPYSCDADPEGGRLVFWGMYGRSVITLDGGKTWANAGDGHHDWGAVDWSDPAAKTMWVCPHGGNVISFDAGKTWNKKAEDRITSFGIFDAKTFAGLLVDAVFVSSDPPNDFVKKTTKLAPAAETCLKVYKGVGYWISPQGLLVSPDKGQSWQVQGQPLGNPIAGPYFGENANHIMVVTSESFLETTDGGKNWLAVAPSLGDAHWNTDKGETRNCRFFAWDAKNNIVYGAKLRDSAMKCVLAEKKVGLPVVPTNEKPKPLVFVRKPDGPAPGPDVKVLWDGERVFPKSFGQCNPRANNAFRPQTDEVHQGKVALEYVIANAPVQDVKAVVQGSWNWHGWYPDDSGDDITGFTHFVFWMKVEKGKTIDFVAAGLESSKPKLRCPRVDVTRYCPTALDGQWHEIAIPVGDLIVEGSKFNPKKAWELELESRCAPAQLPYTIYFDDIALVKRPVEATTAPATKPAAP